MISFNKWLRNFGIEEGPPDESPYTIQRALHDRYRSIRATNDPYPTTDYDKAHISASGAIEYSEKVFARAREPYGHIALLTNGEENKNGSIDGWFYREYKGASHGQAGERLSLNVFMAPGLIRKLDEILEEDKGENIKQYKVPENWRGWIHRHDPATIYFEKLTPELAEKIVKAIYGGGYLRPEKAKEFVQSTPPHGIKLPAGIYYNKEPSNEDVKAMFQNLAKIPLFHAEAMEVFNKKGDFRMSAGEYYVLKKFMRQFKEDADKIIPESIKAYIEYRSKDIDNNLGKPAKLQNQKNYENFLDQSKSGMFEKAKKVLEARFPQSAQKEFDRFIALKDKWKSKG